MAEQYGLLACPDDIFFLILEQCEQRSVRSLSLTSKALRLKCIPELYREVDLSSHNLGRFTENEDRFRIEQWANMDDYNRPENLLSRQRSFLRTMNKCPKYAAYVRCFSWTLIWYDQHDEDGLSEIEYQLWTVFSHLERVEKLNLAALPQDKFLEAYTRQIPSVLFPHVTELRLTGWMTHKLIANIFNSINVAKLRVLCLDALQEEGSLPDGSPMPEDINKECWDSEWRARLCKSRTADSDPTDCWIIFPGPLWLIFLPLTGKFDSLQYLEIRIPPLEEARMDEDCPDYKRYISVMAELIASVAPTLERLVIDYAQVRIFGNAKTSGRSYNFSLHHRLRRSEIILRSLLPSFCFNDESKWKSLRSVSLRGFLQDAGVETASFDVGEVGNIQDKIKDALTSRGILFEWVDDSPRPAFLFLGYNNGASEAALEQFDRLVRELDKN